MNELPLSMNIRFWFYLNFLPIFQDIVTYSSLIIGIILISVGIYKIFVYPPNKSISARQWLNSKMKNQKLQFFNNRRMSCKINEMDTYSSLIESKNVNTVPEGITKLLSLKEDIV